MAAFYLPRGQTLEYMLNLTFVEKLFFKLAQQKYKEDELEKYKIIFGEGK